MVSTAEALNRALEFHQGGRLDEAEKLYRNILLADPAQAKAWQFLGVLCGQRGRHDLACEYLGRAVSLDPHDAIGHCNLGNAYRSLGRLVDAASCYRQATRIQPGHVAAFFDLAVTLQELGSDNEAIAYYQKTLDLEPRVCAGLQQPGKLAAQPKSLGRSGTLLSPRPRCRSQRCRSSLQPGRPAQGPIAVA